MKRKNIKRIRLIRNINDNIRIEVDDGEDYVPEINIDFENCDLIFEGLEKFEIGELVLNYIKSKLEII